jgi:hypothetical protein
MWLTGQQIGNAAFYERRPLSCRAIHCGVFVAGPIPEQRAEYVAKADEIGNRQFARLLAEGDKRSQDQATSSGPTTSSARQS